MKKKLLTSQSRYRIILTTAFSLLITFCSYSQNLIVQKVDGSKEVLNLQYIKKISFENKSVVLTSKVDRYCCPFSDFEKLYFTESTSIAMPPSAENTIIKEEDNFLYFFNADHATANIYNGNGTIIAKINISSQQYAYDISSLTPGIYFIVLNHTVFKTRKK